MQLGEGPLRVHPIGFACLWGHSFVAFPMFLTLSFLALGALSNTGEVFQPNQGMRMLLDDVFGSGMIGLQLQPSLSLCDTLQATFRPASALLLQAFAQSRVVICLVSYSFPWREGWLPRRSRGHGQIPNAYIHADDLAQLHTGWLMLNESYLSVASLLREDHTTVKSTYTYPLITLKRVVTRVGYTER
jgi:hypothetical protein